MHTTDQTAHGFPEQEGTESRGERRQFGEEGSAPGSGSRDSSKRGTTRWKRIIVLGIVVICCWCLVGAILGVVGAIYIVDGKGSKDKKSGTSEKSPMEDESLSTATKTKAPSVTASILTTRDPSMAPSIFKTEHPSMNPTALRSEMPSTTPSVLKSENPTTVPTSAPILPTLPPTSGVAVPCENDGSCDFVMASIEAVMPPESVRLSEIPGTCQNFAREWVRSNKDLQYFTAHRVSQRYALAVLYCEWDGTNWPEEGKLWLSDLHECDWMGTLSIDPCGRQQQIQILRLRNQNIEGKILPEVSVLSSLWELTLSDNQLEGPIPTELERLTELDTLSLSSNLIKGSIPGFLWEFEDMTHLDLGQNELTGTIPSEIYLSEPNLRFLFLEENKLFGQLPTDLGELVFKRLHLDGNAFSGEIPSGIHSVAMEELFLHDNSFSGTFPTELFAADIESGNSRLRAVTLYGNDFTGSVEEMCPLMTEGIGSLSTFQVDVDKMICSCCTGGI